VPATRQRDTAVNVNKGYIPSLRRLQYFGSQNRSGRGASPGKKDGSAFYRAHSCVGATRTMKLLRTAFWLGVVIYNLPSPTSQSAAPASHLHGGQGLATKAASQFCPQPLALCTKTAEALPKRGEPGERDSSRDAIKFSQDTLTPADLVVPWRGLTLRTRPVAKRSI
jgi:hypothetical protein